MVLNTPEGAQYHATSADSVFLVFPKEHELLNGFWHDMEDGCYMFISEYSPSFHFIIGAALEETGYVTLSIEAGEYDLEDAQIESIIGCLGKFMVYSLESELSE